MSRDWRARRDQRAVVLQLLRDDHEPTWSRRELERELSDIQPAAIGQALGELAAHGLVSTRDGQRVWATPALCHLDALDLIVSEAERVRAA